MRKIFLMLCGFVPLALLAGCQHTIQGDGIKQSETRQVDTFQSIRVVGNYQVNVNIGTTQQVSITTDNNLIPYVKTDVRDKTLIIQTKNGVMLQSSTIPQIDITTKQLSDIGVVGSATMNASGINADKFEISTSGTGNANVSGTTDKLKIKLVGSGQIVADNLIAQKAEVNLVGTGMISVQAVKKLEINLSGAGKVQYYGEPRELEQKISGSGEITGIPNAEKSPTQNP